MKIKRPNCEVCLHKPVCNQSIDVDIFKEDIAKMPYLNEKTYEQKLSVFEVHIVCKHFMKQGEYVKTGMDV